MTSATAAMRLAWTSKRISTKKPWTSPARACNVILDWGFWSRKERTDVSAYYKNADIDFEWHYIDISDADWAKNIEARNAAVAAGETTDYAVDSGLLQKVLTLFETPIPDEIDVWFTNRR